MTNDRFARSLTVVCVAVLITLQVAVATAQAEDDKHDSDKDSARIEAIVRQFMPAVFTESNRLDPEAQQLHSNFALADLDQSGQKTYVIAAYTDSTRGAIRVLRIDGTPRIVSEPDVPIFGKSPHVELLDVDGDGIPEVVAHFDTDRGAGPTWVFRWQRQKLVSLTPTIVDAGIPNSALRGAVFENLDGNGRLVAINGAHFDRSLDDGVGRPLLFHETFRLKDGVYAKSSGLYYYERLYGFNSRKFAEVTLGRLDQPYVLRVVNGDNDLRHRVKKARIIVNDATLLSWGDGEGEAEGARGQSENEAEIRTVMFQPRRTNVISYVLAGERQDTMVITIQPSKPIESLKVTPSIPCIWQESGGLFTASFGYDNPNPISITLPIGISNAMSGDRPARGQPVIFRPGRHEAAFWVQSNSEPLTWSLEGAHVTADLRAARCSGSPPVGRLR